MVGDQNGEMNLSSGLTRAQLAVVLTRLSGKQENVQAEEAFYTSQCKFSDVPEWAGAYIGYCYVNGLMMGYDTGLFGAYDGVTPAAACTVVLRYMAPPDVEWDYSSACQTALGLGITTAETVAKPKITRGELAIMLYRALGNENIEVHKEKPMVTIASYKGPELSVGERSGLIISPAGTECIVTSSDPTVAAVEQIAGNWVAIAKMSGTVTITAVSSDGTRGELVLTVVCSTSPQPDAGDIDLAANMEIREEMIELINEVRRENDVTELPTEQALMDAAQDISTQKFSHHEPYEWESMLAHGWPYGGGVNLTWFNHANTTDIAQQAVSNWVNSPGHFQTMTLTEATCIGVGVTVENDIAYCYMIVGDPSGHNPFE